MRVAVDSNVLLDIHLATSRREEESYAALRNCRATGGMLAICPVVFAECGAAFPDVNGLVDFLEGLGIEAQPFSSMTSFAAGQTFARYRKTGGPRARILPDFLVGAHAMIQADRLLTRDRGFYREYFRGLKVIEP